MPKSPSSPKHWAVVGGGVLGMGLASKLVGQGQQVSLLEAGDSLGGLTSGWQIGDVTWDRFYHVTLLSDTRWRGVLDDLGLDREIQWVQTRTGFYSDGKLHSLSSSFEFLKFPVLNPYQKLRLALTIVMASRRSDRHRLERMGVQPWLERWSGRSTFQRIWLPLLKAKLGEAHDRVSAAFIWSYINRMYKARRSGMKREMFGYVPGGYDRILRTWSQCLTDQGVQWQARSTVVRVQSEYQAMDPTCPPRLQVVFTQDGQPRQQIFDRVVMTTPCPVIARVCQGLTDEETRRLSQVEYLGVQCTSMLLPKPLGGFYVTNITDDWVPLTGIIEMGSLVPPEKLGGHYLVYLPRYLLADDPRFRESDDAVHDRCMSTLERMYPDFRRQTVAAVQTARAAHVMAIPTLGYSDRLPAVRTSVPGLYVLNSAQIVEGTLNVNETLELLEIEWERSFRQDLESSFVTQG